MPTTRGEGQVCKRGIKSIAAATYPGEIILSGIKVRYDMLTLFCQKGTGNTGRKNYTKSYD